MVLVKGKTLLTGVLFNVKVSPVLSSLVQLHQYPALDTFFLLGFFSKFSAFSVYEFAIYIRFPTLLSI